MDCCDNLFRKLIIISIIIHSLFLLGLSRLKVVPARRYLSRLEINYKNLRIEEPTSKRLFETAGKRIAVNNKEALIPQHYGIKKIPNQPAYEKNASTFGPFGKNMAPARIKIPVIREKSLAGVVAFPQANSPFLKNPAYMSYYDIIREKIKSVAILSSVLNAGGEVYLTFVLDSDGQLKALKLIDEKSVPDQALRQLAYSFVEQAAPFPPFSKELKSSQLSFNVIIEFRLND